jgi:hypothetical protein
LAFRAVVIYHNLTELSDLRPRVRRIFGLPPQLLANTDTGGTIAPSDRVIVKWAVALSLRTLLRK